MSVNVELFWEDTGTTGLVGNLTRIAGDQPDVDLTTVDAARFRVRMPDRSVAFWSASILASPAPTATTISIRHTFADGDLAVGPMRAWIEVSTDGGATYYTARTYSTLTGVDS